MQALLLISLSLFSLFSFAAEERVSLNSIESLPSFDLIYNGEELTAEEAWDLKKKGVDLSRLEPSANDTWSRRLVTSNNEAIEVNDGDLLDFSATITSYTGLLRFNVKKEEGLGKFFTVLLDKKIHTLLLRKNYLEKLGYKIPPVKYLKKLKIKFPDKKTRNFFFKRSLPEGTLGGAARWIGKSFEEKDDQLVYEFQDLAIMVPSEKDTFNVSVGVPTNRRLTSRTMKSLVLPYSILNLRESVNKFAWYEGNIENQNIILPHFFPANFGASYDDLLWMGRIISKLTKADIEDAVKKSFFPAPVEKILIEKISSRQNYLLDLLKIKSNRLVVNEKPSYESSLIEGKLKKQDWVGYATNFAHGDRKSPLDDVHYFIFSKLQKLGIDSLLAQINKNLRVFDVAKSRRDFQLSQFQRGLDRFVQTGEFIEFGVDTFTTPVVNGIAIVSRDIVVGNIEGTDNLVQLADTIGYGIDLGVQVGIENLADSFPITARTTLSYIRTYSHLKPVHSLKESLKEPYRNIIVPLVKKNIAKTLNTLSLEEASIEGDVSDEKAKELKSLFDKINEDLQVGESLIITDRVIPQGLISAQTPLTNGFRLSLGLVARHPFTKRLHIFRKSADVIQVFEDKGKKLDITFSASVSNLIPLLSVEASKESGKYSVRVHEVNLNSNLDQNPDFFSNVHGLTQVLETGDTELLEAQKKPFLVEAKFKDKAKKGSFLIWKVKKLLKDTFFKVTSPTGSVAKFISYSTDVVKGVDYENFARDIVNYYTNKIFSNAVVVDVDRFQSPQRTIKGKGKTTKTEFQARIKNNSSSDEWEMKDIQNPFILISKHVEGWKIKRKKILKIAKDLNQRYKRNLFNESMLREVKKLSLYNIGVFIQIYEKGFRAIEKLSWDKVSDERTRMYGRSYCRPNSSVTADFSKTDECKAFSRIRSRIKKCKKLKKKEKSPKEIVKCFTKLAEALEDGLDLEGFGTLLGGKDNFYVYSSINGLMSNSEKLNDAIVSNSVGKVGSRYFLGPVQEVVRKIGINPGEFYGLWMRETL